ncbi:MAG: hypothetical protein ABFD81_07120 [Syntrophaceae bacterium]
MKLVRYTAPALKPITLATLKTHLRIDSGSYSDNMDTAQSIAAGSHGVHELMTLDVAPGGAGWAAGDTITGVSSSQTCVVVTKLTGTTYYVRDRSGAFTLGEVLTNGTATADQGATYPTFATGYYLIGTGVDVLGYTAIVNLSSGPVGSGGTNDTKIQDSDDDVTYADWADGAFTKVTSANDNAVQEKEYTGGKQYIRVISKVLTAACEFGVDVVRINPLQALDDELNDLIDAATAEVERETNRKLLTQTWDLYLDDWPDDDFIEIPFGNLQNTAGVEPVVTYKDTDGTETTLTVTTDYLVETNDNQEGRIVLPYGGSWPSADLYPSNPIKVRFTCGWTAATSIPKQIIAAVKFKAEISHKRGADAKMIQERIDSLLCDMRLWP